LGQWHNGFTHLTESTTLDSKVQCDERARVEPLERP